MSDADFDVVVVGGGAAGLSAALRAAEAGATALVAEGQRELGGSSRLSDAIFMAAGTDVQREAGFDDSPDALFHYYMTGTRWRVQPSLARAFSDGAVPALEWLVGHGVRFPVEQLTFSGAEDVPRGHEPVGNGAEVVAALERACRARDVEIALDNRVEDLVLSDGRVTGIRARGEEIRAGAVVVATGGFAQNRALLERFFPDGLPGGDATFSVAGPGSQGDGILLGERVGASITGQGRGHWVPLPLLPSTVVYVDPVGRRFVDEEADHSVRTAASRAFGGVYYALFDDGCRRRTPASRVVDPYFDGSGEELDVERDDLRQAARAGDFFPAPSVGALAKQVGMVPALLEETVAAYNDGCRRGVDERFGKSARSLLALEQPPYYLVRVRLRMIVVTACGLRIDDRARVLDEADRPIPGLFAAGETTGGVLGDIYLGHGNSITNCIVFGRIAGQSAAAFAGAITS